MTSKHTYIYFHISCINNCHSVVTKLYNAIKYSGLYDKIDNIFCGVLASDESVEHLLFEDPKIKILYASNKIELFERQTLHFLYEHSKTEDFNVLYIHSKGISHDGKNPCVEDWVDYLTYFNIYKHSEFLKKLEIQDVVGVNLINNYMDEALHFSGNFWWSKSSHIRNLNPNIAPSYNCPEFWITSSSGNFSSLFTSNVNHYEERFSPDKYIGHPMNT